MATSIALVAGQKHGSAQTTKLLRTMFQSTNREVRSAAKYTVSPVQIQVVIAVIESSEVSTVNASTSVAFWQELASYA